MSDLSALRPFTSIDHNWEETTIYDCNQTPFCLFNIHDLGTVTEENQEEMEKLLHERVERVLELLNGDYYER